MIRIKIIFSFYQININTKIYLNEIIKENEFEKILTERKEYKETVKLYYNGYEIPHISKMKIIIYCQQMPMNYT